MWVTFYPFSLNKKTIVGPTNRHKDLLKIVAVAIRRRKKFFFPFFFFGVLVWLAESYFPAQELKPRP